MLDLGWTEIFLIAGVAVLVVAPKDLPRAMRSVGQWIGQIKQMARGFQKQFNDAIKDTELEEVKKGVESIGKINPLSGIKKDIIKAGLDIDKGLDVTAKKPVAAAAKAAKSVGTSKPAESAGSAKPVASASPSKKPAAKVSPSEPAKTDGEEAKA